MVSIKLLGGAALEDEGAAIAGPAAQRHRIALLALLVVSPSRALSRDKLMAYLWPERDSRSARKLLNQSVYALRRRLGAEVILSVGEELRLQRGRIRCDVIAFEEALATGEHHRAVELYSGPFLDGFFLDRALGFEHRVEGERRRLADAYARALAQLAESAEERGDVRSAVEWWKALAAHDPYDSAVALRLVQMLDAAGNPAGALKHAADHKRRLREDLAIDPPRDLNVLVESLGREPRSTPDVRSRERRILTESRPRPDSLTGRGQGRRGALEVETPSDVEPPRKTIFLGTLAGAGALLAVAVLLGLWLDLIPLDAPPGPEGDAIPLSDIERVVNRELDRRLGGGASTPAGEARTKSIAAYELYLRGTDPSLLRSDSTAWAGVDYLRRAIAFDSSYAAPWAGLACLYIRVSGSRTTGRSRAEIHRLAEEAALRAVELDDSLSAAHASLALVRMADFDFSAAERHLRRAIELDPTQVRPREWLVTVHIATRRTMEAIEVAEGALEVGPLSATATAELARALSATDRCDEALARLRSLQSLQPPLLRAGTIAAHCHARAGRLQEAGRILRAQVDETSDVHSLALLGHVVARAGQREEALRIREDLEHRWRTHAAGAFPVAIVEAGLNHRDEAFNWLDRALEDGSFIGTPLHLQLMRTVSQVLGEDPRYEGLWQRLHPLRAGVVAMESP